MKSSGKPNLTPAAFAALAVGDLENAVTAMTPGGIEAQEKAGQATLVASSLLPREMRTRAEFEALGFVFGTPVDDLFLPATLPPGWTKKASDHSMHSVILDDQGRERVDVFYKAAFYDRRADMGLHVRYRLRTFEDVADSPDRKAVRLLDHDGTVLREFGTYDRKNYAAMSELHNAAREHMDQDFPDWCNPLAYW